MPATLAIRTRPFTDAEREAVDQADKVLPYLKQLANGWASYVVFSGNAARTRQMATAMQAQVANMDLPVEVCLAHDLKAQIAGANCIPADLRNGAEGYCIVRYSVNGADLTEPLPQTALLPYGVRVRNHGALLAEGRAADRYAAEKLLKVMRTCGATHLDLTVEDTVIETMTAETPKKRR